MRANDNSRSEFVKIGVIRGLPSWLIFVADNQRRFEAALRGRFSWPLIALIL
jgi:hypothetical protein